MLLFVEYTEQKQKGVTVVIYPPGFESDVFAALRQKTGTNSAKTGRAPQSGDSALGPQRFAGTEFTELTPLRGTETSAV